MPLQIFKLFRFSLGFSLLAFQAFRAFRAFQAFQAYLQPLKIF